MRVLRDAKAFTILILAICAIICSYTLPAPAGSSGAVSGGVAETRAINTTSPVAGGGDLSADRTITFSNVYVDPSINGFRVSLTSLTPVTTADVASGTALYLCTYTSDRMSIWDGSEWDVLTVTDEPVVYLTGLTADTNYDVFAQSSAGSVTIDATLVAWTNATTRATALDEQDGVWTKGGDRTRRYVATIRATGAAAVDDTEDARFLFNAQNRVPRVMRRAEATNSWTYATATVRQARDATVNQIRYVVGLNEDPVKAWLHAVVQHSVADTRTTCGIGVDSTTAFSGHYWTSRSGTAAVTIAGTAEYFGYPGLGYHALTWLEETAGATATFSGDAGIPLLLQSGLYGEVRQ